MDDTVLVNAHFNIFKLAGESSEVVGLMLVGNSERNHSETPIYKFNAIVRIPTSLPDLQPTPNDMVLLKKMRSNVVGGPAINYVAMWKKTLPNGNRRKKTFEVRGQINPETIMDWEIVDGNYYIKVDLVGSLG